MCAIYDALASGEPLPAAEPVPFSRFVTWLAQQNQDDALAFWANTVRGLPAPILPALDRPPANVTTRTHRACRIRLSRETSSARRPARAGAVTVSRLMQAAWALLLARYSGETDVAFGLTLSGRPADLAHVERIAGPFINTLPVRVSLEGDPRLADLLQSLQRQFFDIEQHGHVGLADIQRHCHHAAGRVVRGAINVYPPTDRSGFPSKSFVLGGIAQEARTSRRTSYDLMVDVALLESIGITITYVEEMFDAATIDAILSNLRTLA
jgi:non-ribosomal peptide synthetase component F